jgi:hypothetical protein
MAWGQTVVETFPHYAAGGYWTTTIRIYNHLAKSQTIRLETFDPNGFPQTVSMNGGAWRNSIEVGVVANSTAEVALTANPGEIRSGRFKLTFLGGDLLPYIVFYRDSSRDVEGATIRAKGTPAGLIAYDQTNGYETSIAVSRKGSDPSGTMILQCWDKDGVFINGEPIVLRPGEIQKAYELRSIAGNLAGKKGICRVKVLEIGEPDAYDVTTLSLSFKGKTFMPTTIGVPY